MFPSDGLSEIRRPNVLIHGGGSGVMKPLSGGVRPGSLISSTSGPEFTLDCIFHCFCSVPILLCPLLSLLVIAEQYSEIQLSGFPVQLTGPRSPNGPGGSQRKIRTLSRENIQSSLIQLLLCPTLCDPMDCSMPGFLVHHQLLELAQTHVHQVGVAIQPSHPLPSPCPAFNLSQHQGLFS